MLQYSGQALVKSAFMDEELNKHMKLTSANSINVARFLPQAFYYFNAYARMKEKGLADKLVICVPSGNFGNITAGLFGHEMGLPIHRFIAANNANDIFYEYLQTGKYNPQPSKQTIANAMEQIPVIGPIAKVVTFRTYENKTNNFEANIQIPQIEAAPETLNKSIEEYAQELIAAYEGELSQSQGEGSYSLDSSYKVVTDNDRYLCLRIDTTIVMASGAQSTKIFTIDKTTGKQLSLKELFKDRPEMLSSITANIKEQMASQMAADDSVSYFYNSDMPEDDFKELTGDESFYFNEEGLLVIAFDEYEVAPGYMGAVEFTIPSSVAGTF